MPPVTTPVQEVPHVERSGASEFVVAPMLTRNTVSAGVQTTSAQMPIVETQQATARLSRAIPIEPLTITSIDRRVVPGPAVVFAASGDAGCPGRRWRM